MINMAMVILAGILSCSPFMVNAQEDKVPEVSDTLVKRFNLATKLAQEGKNEESLQILKKMFGPFEDASEPVRYSLEFKAEVYFRIAYIYMDTSRYAAARKVFEAKGLVNMLPELSQFRVHSYQFAYGNTLGALGEIDLMMEQMMQAIDTAPEDGATTDARTCWVRMMDMLKAAQSWQKLEETCFKAHAWAKEHENYTLQFQAGEYAFFAYVGLKKYGKARTRGKAVLKWYQDSLDQTDQTESPEYASQKVVEWKQHLKDLPE